MILFDYRIFFLQKFGGISRYFIELIKQLEKDGISYELQSMLHQNFYLKNINTKKKLNFYINNYPRYSRKIIEKLNRLIFERTVINSKYNIFNNNYYENYKIKKNIIKVSTIYDFTHEIFSKEYDYKRNLKSKSINQTDHFFCISKNTKNDLCKFYNIDKNKISVIYLGGDHLPKPNDKINTKPFILYVGYRDKYKNFIELLDAYSQSQKLQKDFNIICFGNDNFTNEETSFIKKFNLSEKIVLFRGSDQLLANLYASASCHVITSKYEGFGITAVEAYNFDCPVIHSGNSSLQEIAPLSGKYEMSAESLKEKLEKILYSIEMKNELILQGRQLRELFTWKNCSKKTIKKYKELTSIKTI